MSGTSNNKAIISTTPANVGTPQPFMVREMFDDAIFDKGYNAYIERAVTCPCKVKGTNQPLSSCQNCGGVGYIFIDKQSTKLLCTSMTNRNKFEIWTEKNMGTVSITSRPQDRLSFQDRVTLTDLETIMLETKLLTKSQNGTFFAFTIYEPIEFYHVFFFISPDVPLKYLTKDTNYTFDNNKIIVTSVPGISNLNTITNPTISIRYVCNPTYYVIDLTRDIIKQPTGKPCMALSDHVTNFPMNSVGRRCHLVLDAPDFSGSRLIDNTNYSQIPIQYDYPQT